MTESNTYIQKKIDKIVFKFFSPKVTKDMAACKIVTPELYDKEGYPVDGGLMDIRLGVIDPGIRCRTCGQGLKDCPGHFGYIELARPIIHISFNKMILDVLKCTCQECGRVLIPNEKKDSLLRIVETLIKLDNYEGSRKKVRAIISLIKQNTKCPHCNAKQKNIKIEKPTKYYVDGKRMSPSQVRAHLEKVPNDDLLLLGLDPESMRPEWTVLTILSIPPVTMRSSITLETGERSEDDLTHKLGDIVRINQRLFENINAGAPEIIIEDLWDLLQYHVTTFFDNAVAQLPPARHRSGQPLKTITERIKSKEGRIRHNLAGKRVNFCARTVISPDPMLGFNEVGVPREIAMILTVPEKITKWNIEYLKKFVEKGPKKYPGSNYVVRPDGKKKKITDETKEALLEEIQPGFTIERHLMDGDIAVFNRQPSLHRMSMMCHKVKVLPGKTFRINPAVCAPYNADFDGDEMNLHIPQTQEARAEAEILMQVQTQIISVRYGLSIVGCNQDAITGNYLLTKDMSMDKKEAAELLFSVGVTDFSKLDKYKGDVVSGKQIFSVLLPKDFNFIGETREEKEQLKIINGELISGVLDKSNLGEGSGLLIRSLHKVYGADKCIEILGYIYRLGIKVLLKRGFTIGIGDIDVGTDAKKQINDILKKSEKECDKIIKQFEEGNIEPYPGKTQEITSEIKVQFELNKARNDTSEIISKFLNKDSHTMIMANCGAGGKMLNVVQMVACVGQQSTKGGRIDKGYESRTLSCFAKNSRDPASRGFVYNGFKDGLKPYEFFFGALTGRDSLMDTALRTPKSGYLYRRLANAMQDLKVDGDGSVRDSSNQIVQFKYGDDGVDVSRSEKGTINVRRIIREVMEDQK
ncbi:MAG: DNA-directed RNA polymerase subunit A' [Candidatus Woesearchaeota archaeon]|jgi:DNA-directed RNA polymerase subunit A'